MLCDGCHENEAVVFYKINYKADAAGVVQTHKNIDNKTVNFYKNKKILLNDKKIITTN